MTIEQLREVFSDRLSKGSVKFIFGDVDLTANPELVKVLGGTLTGNAIAGLLVIEWEALPPFYDIEPVEGPGH